MLMVIAAMSASTVEQVMPPRRQALLICAARSCSAATAKTTGNPARAARSRRNCSRVRVPASSSCRTIPGTHAGRSWAGCPRGQDPKQPNSSSGDRHRAAPRRSRRSAAGSSSRCFWTARPSRSSARAAASRDLLLPPTCGRQAARPPDCRRAGEDPLAQGLPAPLGVEDTWPIVRGRARDGREGLDTDHSLVSVSKTSGDS